MYTISPTARQPLQNHIGRIIEQGDCETFAAFLSEQLTDTISFYDYQESYFQKRLYGKESIILIV